MLKASLLVKSTLIAALGATLVVPTIMQPVLADSSVTVNWNSEKQEIHGFGGSTAWYPDELYAFPEATRTEIMKLLFSPTEGIGVSILRNRIDPKINPSEGVWNWESQKELANVWLTKEAKDYGVQWVWAAPWTAPAWMKDNNNHVDGGKLLPEHITTYADYLARYVTEYKTRHGIDLHAISIQNEPNKKQTWESMQWTGAEMRDFLKGPLKTSFETNGITAKVIATENESWSDTTLNTILNDANAAAMLDIGAAHFYGNSTVKKFTTAANKGKPVWMTEHYLYGSNINVGLNWAKEVHDFLTVAELNAVHTWWLIADKDSPFILMNMDNYTYTTNKQMYTFGNYSKFVRPGYKMIEVSNTNLETDVFVTAFKDPNSGKFAIVAINKNDSAKNLSVSLNGVSASSVTPHRTSATENLISLPSISVSGGSFTASLAAGSVTSFTGVSSTATTLIEENFNNMTLGNSPSGWTVSTPTNTSVTVDNPTAILGRSLKLYDNNSSTKPTASKSFTSQSGKITWEFRFRVSDTNKNAHYVLRNGTTEAVEISVRNGSLAYHNGTTAVAIPATSITTNTWYTVRVTADIATKKFDLHLDSILRLKDGVFRNNVSSVNNIMYAPGNNGAVNATSHIDNVMVVKP